MRSTTYSIQNIRVARLGLKLTFLIFNLIIFSEHIDAANNKMNFFIITRCRLLPLISSDNVLLLKLF